MQARINSYKRKPALKGCLREAWFQIAHIGRHLSNTVIEFDNLRQDSVML